MLRSRAVRSLLLDLAGIRERGGDEDEPAVVTELQREALDRAARRAGAVVLIDAAAIMILFWFRDREIGFLPLARSDELVLTFGVLVITAHLGFRLSQLMLYLALARVWDELPREE